METPNYEKRYTKLLDLDRQLILSTRIKNDPASTDPMKMEAELNIESAIEGLDLALVTWGVIHPR